MQHTVQTIVNALSVGALDAIIALGIALVFSVMRLVNFAHGALIMVGAFAVYGLSTHGFVVWAVGALVIVLVLALLMERVAFRPVRNADMTTLLVTSFAVNTIIEDTSEMIYGGLPKSIGLPSFFTSTSNIGSYSISNLSLITIGTTAVSLALLVVFFNKTRVGVQMRAAAEDFRMARLLGIKANSMIAWAFGISGLLAGLAAILLVAQIGSAYPSFGLQPIIIGFVAVVIGGMGSLPGAVAGGLVLGAGTTVLQAELPAGAVGYRDAMVYAAVILILLFRPQGIFGTTERQV
jgi:branched-chain amino acid transport system permease protein